MTEDEKEGWPETPGKSLVDRVFPPKYDFHKMLRDQAKKTAEAIEALEKWVKTGSGSEAERVHTLRKTSDEGRWKMEARLIKAFATPFDRTDIYEMSRQMARIMDYSELTLREMDLFEIVADRPIFDIAEKLSRAARALAEGIIYLESDPQKAQSLIPSMRKAQWSVEKAYFRALDELLDGEVTMGKLRRKEVYHDFKVIMKNLGYTVDILHRMVVRHI